MKTPLLSADVVERCIRPTICSRSDGEYGTDRRRSAAAKLRPISGTCHRRRLLSATAERRGRHHTSPRRPSRRRAPARRATPADSRIAGWHYQAETTSGGVSRDSSPPDRPATAAATAAARRRAAANIDATS